MVYNLKARCPAWDNFTAEVFPEDAQQLAYELPAWLMSPDTSEQKAVLLLGEGANGKSTYLAGINAFLGRENCTSISLQKLETDRLAVARLIHEDFEADDLAPPGGDAVLIRLWNPGDDVVYA